jgi:predicted deacylase
MQTMQLQATEIIGRSPGPHVLVTGGVHGDEYEPMAAIRRLAVVLVADTLRGRVTLVPVVNEPAFRRGERTGDDGLDLARVCPGRANGSATEQIAHALSELIRAADFYVDLHTGGRRLAVLPLVGYTMHPDRAVLEQQRRMACAFNLPIVWGTDHRLNGRSLSVARDARVPAIYAEYQGPAACDPGGVAAYVDGCLNILACLGMLDRTAPPCRIAHVVEDERPDSGYMQICHPSPSPGFFEPAVRLGDRVSAGAVLGTVCDALGRERRTVPVDREGIVIVLRACPSVQVGDSLGVVLETNSARGREAASR